MPLPSGAAKRQSVGSWTSRREYGAHLHLPVGHVVRAILHVAKDAVEGLVVGRVYLLVAVSERHGPWILRNCSTFSAALRICVSLDTRCVKSASVIMSRDGGDSVTVERRMNSEAAS